MNHQLIHTGAGWTCLRCHVAWDQGEEIGECGGVDVSAEALYTSRPDRAHEPRDRVDTPVMTAQVGGRHYASLTIQPTEFCQRNGLDFCVGSILKYVTRHRAKNGVEDLKKARHFVEIRETYPEDIWPPRSSTVTMREYVELNAVPPAEAEALHRLEAYYNAALAANQRAGARRLIDAIDNLIAGYETSLT